jgi:putative membrane protein
MNSFNKSVTLITLASVVLVGCMTANTPATAEQGKGKDHIIKAAMPKQEPEFNDLEIAHIAYTAGSIDIRYAHLALALSDDPEVRTFAELMVRDHTAVNNKALDLVKKLKITPQDNAMSRKLNQQAKQIREELSQLRGKAFAKRYAANELGYHQTVNNVVENMFIPHAQNAELKALLTAALQTFKAHEGHAANMNDKMM